MAIPTWRALTLGVCLGACSPSGGSALGTEDEGSDRGGTSGTEAANGGSDGSSIMGGATEWADGGPEVGGGTLGTEAATGRDAANGSGGTDAAVFPDARPMIEAQLALDQDSAMPETCLLKTSVFIVTSDRAYAPRHLAAIWIANESGRFVKTLGLWTRFSGNLIAAGEARLLAVWYATTTAEGVAFNRVDAVSGATRTRDGMLSASWNCTDYQRRPMPDGKYWICFEMTESRLPPTHNHCAEFTKGPRPFEEVIPDVPNFTMRTLSFTP